MNAIYFSSYFSLLSSLSSLFLTYFHYRYGQGTRDMAGPTGLTTEKFIDKVSWRLGRYMAAYNDDVCEGDIVVPQRAQQFISKSSGGWLCIVVFVRCSVCLGCF